MTSLGDTGYQSLLKQEVEIEKIRLLASIKQFITASFEFFYQKCLLFSVSKMIPPLSNTFQLYVFLKKYHIFWKTRI